MGLIAMAVPDEVRWHDLECGRYEEDLDVWLALAARAAVSNVLDLGCGSGRVSLALARSGASVTAVDIDPLLLAALDARRGELQITAVQSDVTELTALGDRRWPIALMPMQTIQLLDGRAAREAMLQAVRSHLEPAGLFAAAIVTRFETFDERSGTPAPDIERYDGGLYVSRPLAVRLDGDAIVVERERWVGRSGTAVEQAGRDVIRLQQLDAARLADEASAAGFEPLDLIPIAETGEHVANEVVVLRAI